jgi:hypothetical protein
MPKGKKASTRQAVAGRKNIYKASVMRRGRRGTHYKKKIGPTI